jgi:hypothetical protein
MVFDVSVQPGDHRDGRARGQRALLLATLLLACGRGGASSPDDAGSSDATVPEGGVDAAGDAPPLVCGNGAWTTYGHDARRTSASDGCVTGPLTQAWRYVPSAVALADGGVKEVRAVDHASAQGDAVFLSWGSENFINGQPGGTTQAVDRVDPATGKMVWSYIPVFGDASFGKWATVGLGGVMFDSDGLYWVDAATGALLHGYGVDYWGDVLTDSTQAYANNTMFVDGPPLFVSAYDTMGKQLWQENVAGVTKRADYDSVGAMALDGGTLFVASRYSFGNQPGPLVSGLYAFDPATGSERWLQATQPSSDIAAVDGTVFLAEGTSLVARRESDGVVVWSVPYATPIGGATGPVPVVTPALVIVQEKGGVVARKRGDGSTAWTAPLTPTSDVGVATLHCDTVLAAALGSDTLVAVDAKIHVFALSDGRELWSGVPEGLTGVRMTSPVVVGRRLYVTDRGQVSQLGGTPVGGLVAFDGP